ncbi:MAG: ribosomal protein S18-alanine N-acetyltransferase [Clostridia bacterium]|nr:ribosomal protein S18-alanine N-acetyltransferase [Clostridia bacterium]
MKIEVTKAAESDIAFTLALERETFSLPQSENDFRAMLDAREKHLLIATIDGVRAGYIGAYTVCRETDIMTVAVAPDFRKNGIGRALVNALFDALDGESDAVFLEVRESNMAARTLYQSLGFCEIGKRKNYYKLPTEDAVLCKKDL